MERTVLSWTPGNWLTILLMVFVGFALYGVIVRVAFKATDNG